MKNKIYSLIIGLALCLALSPLAMAEEPSGTVTMTTESVALGIGVTHGTGVLTYQGKDYKFEIEGFSIMDIGGSTVEAKGTVHGLKDLSQFEGLYTMAGAGAAAVKGKQAAVFTNSKDVTIRLIGEQEGIRLTLAAGGLEIKFVK